MTLLSHGMAPHVTRTSFFLARGAPALSRRGLRVGAPSSPSDPCPASLLQLPPARLGLNPLCPQGRASLTQNLPSSGSGLGEIEALPPGRVLGSPSPVSEGSDEPDGDPARPGACTGQQELSPLMG